MGGDMLQIILQLANEEKKGMGKKKRNNRGIASAYPPREPITADSHTFVPG